MPRPKDKSALLELADKNFNKLSDFIESLPSDTQQTEFSTDTLNRNIRDVLCHLHHWHLLVEKWVKVGMDPSSSTKPDIPEKGYTWRTVPQLNIAINELYLSTSLDKSKQLAHQSHQKIIQMIRSYTDDELFTKKKYKWTGSTSFGAYLISATSSHYDWALKLIKKGVNN